MRPLAALLAAAAVLAALLWLRPGGSAAPDDALAPLAAEGVGGPSPAPLGDEAEPRLADAPEPPPVAAADLAAPARAPAARASAGADLRRLLVVERGTRRPVAGAEVHVLDFGALSPAEALRERARGASLAELLRRHGTHATTDAEGRVAVNAAERAVLVVAEHDALWGMVLLFGPEGRDGPDGEAAGASAAETVVELSVTTTLRVRVVDAAGRPAAGVPVALRARSEYATTDAWGVPTDAEGRVDLPHADRVIESVEWAERTSVAVVLPLAPPVEVDVDVADPPELVELALPPTGTARVRVAGAAPEAVLAVQLGLDEATGLVATALVEDGVASFPRVGVGTRLHASVTRADGGEPIRRIFDGPRVPGEVVETVVDLAAVPVLVGRLVDVAGAPLAGERVRVVLEGRSEHASSTRNELVTTSSDGRFRFEAPSDLPLDARLVLRLERVAPQGAPTHAPQGAPAHAPKGAPAHTPKGAPAPAPKGAPVHALRVVPAPLAAGVTELGDVVFAPPPLVVAGVVTDESGRPIEGAALSVETQRTAPADGTTYEWTRVDGLAAKTDEQGRFAVRGLAAELVLADPPPKQRVSARHAQHVSTTGGVGFVTGAADVAIRMRTRAALEGAVLLDPDVSPRAVRLTLVDGRGGTRTVSPSRAGAFRMDGVRPGAGRFTAGVESEPELVVVEDVELVAGETCRDPRLQAIDLRGRLASFTLTVLTPDGELAREGVVQVVPDDASTPQRGAPRWWLRREPLRVVTGRRPLDLSVAVPGYREVVLRAVETDRSVVLQPGPRVRLRVTGVTVPAAPWTLSVALVQPGALPGPARRVAVGTDGTAELAVSAPGVHAVSWQLALRASHRTGETTVHDAPTLVTVADLPGVQELSAHLDPALLAAAQAELEE